MFRALSSRRSHRGYVVLNGAEAASISNSLQAKLSRAASVPAKIFSTSRRPTAEKMNNEAPNVAERQAKKASKIHPIFALLGSSRRSKKATAKPEFQRYIQYLKEGGILAHIKQSL